MFEQMLRDMTDARVYNCACVKYIYIIMYIYMIYMCVYMFHINKKTKKLPYDQRLHL